jgi:hypothetical protein
MNYYKHKTTGDIIGITGSWRDLVDANGTILFVITEAIFPNVMVGNGIICHMISFADLGKNYKRTSRKEALEKYPDFGQYRHLTTIYNVDVRERAVNYLSELFPLRKKGGGVTWIKEHPLCANNSEIAIKAKAIYEEKGMLAAVQFIKTELNTDSLKDAVDIVKSFTKQ